jgi:hypothetical protein
MIQLAFPAYDFKIKERGESRLIFDPVRRKYVMLTPEEWVRQNILVYLCEVMQYPKGLISVEKELKVNALKKRYDIVVYDYDHKPWMLIECKEPDTAITDQTLRQLLSYYQAVQCPYWMLTNGRKTFCAGVRDTQVDWLTALPAHNS